MESYTSIPTGWRQIRRLGRVDVKPSIPDPILGAVDAKYLYKDENGNNHIVVYRTQVAGTPQLHSIGAVKK